MNGAVKWLSSKLRQIYIDSIITACLTDCVVTDMFESESLARVVDEQLTPVQSATGQLMCIPIILKQAPLCEAGLTMYVTSSIHGEGCLLCPRNFMLCRQAQTH